MINFKLFTARNWLVLLLFITMLTFGGYGGCGGGGSSSNDPDTTAGNIEISGSYVQFRTLENPARNQFRGYLGLTRDGAAVAETEVSSVTLSSDVEAANVKFSTAIDIDPSFFVGFQYWFGRWDDTTSSLVVEGPIAPESGYSISFPEGLELAAGNYTYEVTPVSGDPVSTTISYPGRVELPVPLSATMMGEFQPDGSLNLSWTNPAGTFDQIRANLYDQDFNDLLYTRLPNTATSLTIPASLMNEMLASRTITSLEFQVQTRNYTPEGVNIARGISDPVLIAVPAS